MEKSATYSARWWCRLGDSNTRPTHYECVALPAELRRPLSARIDTHRAPLLQQGKPAAPPDDGSTPAQGNGRGNEGTPPGKAKEQPAQAQPAQAQPDETLTVPLVPIQLPKPRIPKP